MPGAERVSLGLSKENEQTPIDVNPRPLWNRERFRRGGGARNAGKRRLEFFPLGRYLKDYTMRDFRVDARAGVNVALLDFPLGMAYASIAGLPIQYGIYSSALATLIGPCFGSSRFLMLGPSNAIAVLTMSALMGLDLEPGQMTAILPLLLVMVGVLLIAGAFFGVARLINYVSRSVITGFITAAAFLIIGNQLRNVMGFSIPKAPTFFAVLKQTFLHIGDLQWPSVAMAAGATLLYFTVRKFLRFLPAVAVVLVVSALANVGLGHWLGTGWSEHVPTLQALPVGHWPLTVPDFDVEMMRRLVPVAAAIAFLSILESSSIAKSLAARAGDRLNLDQQLLSMGIANLGCAFGSGMPISGSLTRSALNYASGTRTPVASMVSGALVATGALTLGYWIGAIPKPALAAIVISVCGVTLIQPRNIRFVLGSTNGDAMVFLSTFGAGLFLPLDTAIYIGTAVSIAIFLRKAAIPELQEYNFTEEGELAEITKKEERPRPQIAILHVEGDLFFGASEIFMDQMRRAAEDPAIRIFILRLKNAHHLDATCALAIEEFIRYLRATGRDLIVSGAREEIYRVFRDSGLLKVLGPENFFPYTPSNPNLSTRNALKRSQEILGEERADIVLLVNKNKKKKEEEDKG